MSTYYLPIKDLNAFSTDGKISIQIIKPIISEINIIADSYKAHNRYGDVVANFSKQKKIILEIEAADLEITQLTADPAVNDPDIRDSKQNSTGYFLDQNNIFDENDNFIDSLNTFNIDIPEYDFLGEIE